MGKMVVYCKSHKEEVNFGKILSLKSSVDEDSNMNRVVMYCEVSGEEKMFNILCDKFNINFGDN